MKIRDDMRKILVFLILIALSVEEASAATYNISGYITNGVSPINNAIIWTGEYIVNSDANGFYNLGDLADSTYTITGSASGYLNNSTSITVSGADMANVNLTLQDVTPPSVITNINNVSIMNNSIIILNATITDAELGVKNATVNVSEVNSTINEAILTLSGDYWINNTIIADKGENTGFKNLTITTYDNAGNVNKSINMTVRIYPVAYPDLFLASENISFLYIPSEVENSDVKENENVTIIVTVYNSGLGDADLFNVSFYDGSPDTDNNIANATITNISAGESRNATIYWNSIIGSHNISIKIDPENTIIETDDSNNNASKNINVSAWQKYYGNVSGNLTLQDNSGNTLTDWNWATFQGNVFISNIPDLNFSNLQALGRKKNGEIAMNDFSKADALHNMTPGSNNATSFYNNNITQLFSMNGTSPRNYTNFTVYNKKIENIAIVNSTNTTNFNSVEISTFITGILWDTSKDDGDGDYGDDDEDIVFISGINVKNTGLGNSEHDYEIAIPSIIRSEGKVYFFVELK